MSRHRPTTLRDSVSGIRRLAPYLRPHLAAERRLLAIGSVAFFAEVGMRLLEPWPLKYVIDGIVKTGGGTSSGTDVSTMLVVACLALVGFTTMRATASYVNTLTLALAGNRILSRVRADVYAHLNKLPLTFHDRTRTGDLVTRVTSDIGRLKDVAVTAALPLAGNTLTLVGMLVVVTIIDWKLALVILLVFPAFLLSTLHMTRRITTVSRTQRRADGALASLATETLSSMRVVQSYSLERLMQQRFGEGNAKSLKSGAKATKLSAGLERKTDLLVGLATALVLYVGARRALAGALTAGELVVFLTYLKAAFKPMRDLAKYTGRIAQAGASAERIADLLQVRPDIVDAPGARPADPFKGEIEFRDVWLAYEPGRMVLRNISLHIPAGQRVALVGPSGAGKSSLAMLVSRLGDPTQGEIRIDGQDLRDLTVDSVRTQLAVVLQETLLFATTIRDNIAHGLPDTSEEEIVAAARLAGAHDFIMRLPSGYDTIVGERGATLSGGERQRIAIARAAMRDAAVVILDEAMTGLDQQTEREVYAALERLTSDRTTLLITHDLDAVLGCDRVIWIDRGTVLDDGVPGEVLSRQARNVPDVQLG
ncbi:ABC transporter ATP-binding protein/permease [Nocardioides sp. WL0053]|uniref:ABC transporter ATP-binding protein/permease n=1 Tax=Nocardioides jiangsuensis TaxID=2866161 RepID=A0ABS7RP35_9ACTN|nr:ABC transporter ATP-binding protein [Nocardioides jiangsuensis]MBY9076716.1 ABC transporter ATP-binding protein/permease [Nocardioides jiangsuensis]